MPVCMRYNGTVGRVRTVRFLLNCDSICGAEGLCLLAGSCDRIAALNLRKQKHPLKLSAIHQLRTAVLWCDMGSGREARETTVSGP